MARRDTREEAEQLAASLQTSYPKSEIRVIEQVSVLSEMQIKYAKTLVARAHKNEVGQLVTSSFEIVEVLKCRECGHEIETIAFGEAGNDLCKDCDAKITARIRAESEKRGIESAREVARHEYFDETDGLPGR